MNSKRRNRFVYVGYITFRYTQKGINIQSIPRHKKSKAPAMFIVDETPHLFQTCYPSL